MLSNKDFFHELREDEEWLNAIMTKETYSHIDPELKNRIVVGDVRKKNSSFSSDETHKELIKNQSKAKKALMDYEFNKNNG